MFRAGGRVKEADWLCFQKRNIKLSTYSFNKSAKAITLDTTDAVWKSLVITTTLALNCR